MKCKEFESAFADLCQKHRVFVAAIYCTADGESGGVTNLPDNELAQELFADIAAQVATKKENTALQ